VIQQWSGGCRVYAPASRHWRSDALIVFATHAKVKILCRTARFCAGWNRREIKVSHEEPT